MTNSEMFKEAHRFARRERDCYPTYKDAFRAALKLVWRVAQGLSTGRTYRAKDAGKMIATVFHFDGVNKAAYRKAQWKLDRDFADLCNFERRAAWDYAEQKAFDERHSTFFSTTINDKMAQYNTYCA